MWLLAGIFAYGETRTRTGDTTIFSRVLYQLSYLAAAARARCYRLDARASGTRSSGRVFPSFEIGQRVDRVPTRRVPAADPHLEVQVGGRRVAGLAGEAESLPRGDRLAGADGQRTGLAVVEHEFKADRRVLDGVVAGAAGLVVGRGDRAGQQARRQACLLR